MSIDEYLLGLGFVPQNGEYNCEHITIGGDHFSLVFDLKALIGNYEALKTKSLVKNPDKN